MSVPLSSSSSSSSSRARVRGTTTHAPSVSSPLNPGRGRDAAARDRRREMAAQRRPGAWRVECGGGGAGRTQQQQPRLLRHQAAEAWRLQKLRRKIAQARPSRQVKPASSMMEAPRPTDLLHMHRTTVSAGFESERRRSSSSSSSSSGGAEMHSSSSRQAQEEYLFRMPDVGFFTPRRIVLATGMTRRLAFLETQQQGIRCAMAAATQRVCEGENVKPTRGMRPRIACLVD